LSASAKRGDQLARIKSREGRGWEERGRQERDEGAKRWICSDGGEREWIFSFPRFGRGGRVGSVASAVYGK